MFTNSLNSWMYLNLEEPDRFSTRHLFSPYARFAKDDDPDDGAGGGGDEGGGNDDDPDDDDAGDKELQTKLQSEVVQSQKYRKRAQTAEKLVTELQEASGRTLSPEDFEAYQQSLTDAESQEQKELVKKGEFDAALAKAEEKFEGQRDQYRAEADQKTTDADARTDKAMALAKRFAGDAPLALALAGAGIPKVSIGIAKDRLSSRVRVEFNDNDDPIITCVDPAGEVILDPDGAAGQSVSVEKFVTDYLASEEGSTFLPPSGDSGSGAYRGGGKPGVTIEELDADPAKKAKFIQEEGTEAYLKLARKGAGGKSKE